MRAVPPLHTGVPRTRLSVFIPKLKVHFGNGRRRRDSLRLLSALDPEMVERRERGTGPAGDRPAPRVRRRLGPPARSAATRSQPGVASAAGFGQGRVRGERQCSRQRLSRLCRFDFLGDVTFASAAAKAPKAPGSGRGGPRSRTEEGEMSGSEGR